MIEAVTMLAVFGVYVMTLCPTVYVGDAGELIAASAVLGVAHPPGYPIFCLWEKCVMTILPIGNIAWRANIGSALATVFGVACLMAVMRKHLPTLPRWGRAGVAAAFGCSLVMWSQSVITEVYALNFLFVAGFLCWGTRRVFEISPLWVAAFVALGAANHHTMILVAALWIMVVLMESPRSRRGSLMMSVGLVMGVMLACYLYIPLRSLTNPVVDWGNPETFEKVFNHISRRQYAAVDTPPRGWGLIVMQIKALAGLIVAQFPWWWLLGAVWGLGAIWKHARRLWYWGIGLSFVMVLVVWRVTNFIPIPRQLDLVKVFLIPPYAFLAIGVGAGLMGVFKKWPRTGTLIFLAFPITTGLANYRLNDLSRQDLVYRFTENVIRTVEPHGVLFAAGDNISFPLAVALGAEGRRSDVTAYDRFGNLFLYVYGEEWLDRFQRDLRRIEVDRLIVDQGRPTYYATMEVSPRLPFSLRLAGLIRCVEGRGHPASTGQLWRRYDLRLPPPLPDPEVFIQHMRVQYAYYQGLWWFERGDEASGLKELARAKREAEVVDPLLVNLGYLYNGRGHHEEAVEAFEAAVRVNPWYMEGYVGLGAALGTMKRLDEAVRVFRTALDRNPVSAEAINALGIAYIKQDRLNEAVQELEENVRINPHFVESYNELGLAFAILSDRARAQGREAEAERQLRHAVELWQQAVAMAPHHQSSKANMERARQILNK